MLDLFIRGGAIGAGALIVLALCLRRPRPCGALTLLPAWITISAYLVVSSPAAPGFSPMLLGALCFVASFSALAKTWLVLDLLARPGLDRRPWLGFAGLTAGVGVLALIVPSAESVRSVMAALIFLGLIGLAARDDRDDLVPGRRLFRRSFITLVGSTGLVISVFELLGIAGSPAILLGQASMIFALTLAFGAYALAPQSDLWATPAVPEKVTRLTPATSALAQRLTQTMEAGIWRTESLSIGALATELGVPEHRLRRLINAELGFRNFSSFINQARIDAARQALEDPAQAARTVLEIAYEVGFASLGPFNRAFKAETGLNPTAYRARALHSADFAKNTSISNKTA